VLRVLGWRVRQIPMVGGGGREFWPTEPRSIGLKTRESKLEYGILRLSAGSELAGRLICCPIDGADRG
jgi:hypothetical protein